MSIASVLAFRELDFGRRVKLIRRLARCLVILVGVAGRNLPTVIAAAAVRDRRRLLLSLGESCAEAAEALGPVYVKVAQIFSYRLDLLPREFLQPLSRLQNHVRVTTQERSLSVIRASLRSALGASIQSFQETEIAAGSIATVHQATTLDGAAVAVKVVRAGVSRWIAIDLECLHWIVRILAGRPRMRGIPLMQTYDLIAEMVAAQTDMIKEAGNLQKLREVLASQPKLIVPAPYFELTTREILVMDYIADAVPLISPEVPEAVFRDTALRVLRALYKMMFQVGFVHCDMHPGNVLVLRDGTAALLDAGLVAILREEDRRSFRDFFLGLATNDAKACYRAIVNSATSVPPRLNQSSLASEVADLVRYYHERTVGEFFVAEFVFRIFDLQRRHRLVGAPGFVAAIWALVMFEGLVRPRYADLDFQAEARPFMAGAIIENVRRFIGTAVSANDDNAA